LQRYGLTHAAAPHDDARLSKVDEKADVVQNQMIVKRLADIAEFDEVARRGRLVWLRDSRAHARPLLLMTSRADAKQLFGRIGFRLSTFDFFERSKHQNQTD
jgi:hypothetical protein